MKSAITTTNPAQIAKLNDIMQPAGQAANAPATPYIRRPCGPQSR